MVPVVRRRVELGLLRCQRSVLPAIVTRQCKTAAGAGKTTPEKLLLSAFAWLNVGLTVLWLFAAGRVAREHRKRTV